MLTPLQQEQQRRQHELEQVRAEQEQLSALHAELERLRGQLAERDRVIADLRSELAQLKAEPTPEAELHLLVARLVREHAALRQLEERTAKGDAT